LWLSSIGHLQGDHSACSHSDLCDREDKLPDLDPQTNAFAKLKEYIELIATLAPRLCRFRHTGSLENYHSLCISYAAKRFDLDYDCMTMRRQLAAIDYNHHLNYPFQFRTDGTPIFTLKWNKDSRQHVPIFRRVSEQKYFYYHRPSLYFSCFTSNCIYFFHSCFVHLLTFSFPSVSGTQTFRIRETYRCRDRLRKSFHCI